MKIKKAGKLAAVALTLIFSIVLTSCNGNSSFDSNLTTGKDLPTGWCRHRRGAHL